MEQFMKAVSGKGLSVRSINLLAEGYFRGPDSLREAINAGKVGWSLEQMKQIPEDHVGCSEFERVFLGDLQRLQKYMQQALLKSQHPKLKSRAFFAQANLLVGSLLSHLDPFHERMKEFYDRSADV